MSHPHHEVTILIDKKEHKSPNPTTGTALYILGHVKPDHDLWLEVSGPGDDTIIKNAGEVIKLKECERFYTAQKTLNPGCAS